MKRMLPSVLRVAPLWRVTMLLKVSVESPVAVEMICASCPTTTDASGMYTLKGLYEGEYELKLANNSVEERLIIKVPEGGAAIEAATLVASDI